MRKFSIITLFVAAALASLALAVRQSASPRHASSAARKEQPRSSDDATQMVIHFASNPQAMPPFLLNDLDGHVISTASLQGKVVLLNFWATWCPPCREEIPMMTDLQNRFKDKLQIVGISMDDSSADEVKQFTEEMKIDYQIVMGSSTLSQEYGGVPALPTTFVVNRDGRIVQKHEGLYPIEVYDSEIRALLGMPVQAKVETFEDTGQIFLKNAINAKELPGVDFAGLTGSQKRAALKRLNSQMCTCGCKLTIAQCRISDSDCTTSKELTEKVVHEIRSGSNPAAPFSSRVRQ